MEESKSKDPKKCHGNEMYTRLCVNRALRDPKVPAAGADPVCNPGECAGITFTGEGGRETALMMGLHGVTR